MRSQPRGDGVRIAAFRVPALLGDAALLHALLGGPVGAVAPAGEVRSTRDLDRLVSGGPLLARRRLVNALLPLVTRRPLGARLMTPRHIPRQRHPPRGVELAGVADLRVPTLLHATLRVLLQAVHIRAAASLTAR